METIRLTVTSEEAGQRADSLLARRLEGLTLSLIHISEPTRPY